MTPKRQRPAWLRVIEGRKGQAPTLPIKQQMMLGIAPALALIESGQLVSFVLAGVAVNGEHVQICAIPNEVSQNVQLAAMSKLNFDLHHALGTDDFPQGIEAPGEEPPTTPTLGCG